MSQKRFEINADVIYSIREYVSEVFSTPTVAITALSLNVSGDVTTSAGNFVATLGSVSAGTTVTAGTSIESTTSMLCGTGLTITTGGCLISAGPLSLTTGNLDVDLGDVTIAAGDLELTAGNCDIVAGTLDVGGLITADAGISVTTVGLTIVAGGLTVTAGGGHIVAGGLDVDAGGITMAADDLELTLGGITVAVGDVEATAGAFISDAFEFITPRSKYLWVHKFATSAAALAGAGNSAWVFDADATAGVGIDAAGGGGIDSLIVEFQLPNDYVAGAAYYLHLFGYHVAAAPDVFTFTIGRRIIADGLAAAFTATGVGLTMTCAAGGAQEEAFPETADLAAGTEAPGDIIQIQLVGVGCTGAAVLNAIKASVRYVAVEV
ncbi:MAG: hypothetical protein M0R66_07635 [Candidatus Omnitrophica bacterium]|nr:hypothetical protein [Candidatus Omnitrophota bacterium]